jgi:hypothetical protein
MIFIFLLLLLLLLLLPWNYSPGWALASLRFSNNNYFLVLGFSPTPNPHLEDQVSIFISPGDWVA